MTVRVRKQVPLDTDDLSVLEQLGRDGSAQAVALHAVTGIVTTRKTSEAERLHAILVAGRKAITEKALEIGYARAAEFDRTDPERQQWTHAMRRRHRLRPFMDENEGVA